MASEVEINRLLVKVKKRLQEKPSSQRFLIAISGVPGSGKSTLAKELTKRLNESQAPNGHESVFDTVCVPMDGFHLYRHQLSQLDDPINAYARRGAPFTFDAALYLDLVKQLREPVSGTTEVIFAPSFDHAKKDPLPNDIRILPTSRIIIFEGNYLSLDNTMWREAADLMDELWFIEVDLDIAKSRLVKRHVESGIAEDEQAAAHRVDNNDILNARQILLERMVVNETITDRGS